MKLKQIYQLAIEKGMEADPRPKREIKAVLSQAKEEQKGLKRKDKPFFDKDRLFNPYSDTRILAGDENSEVKRVLVGIDMEVGEVLLADRLSEKGKKIDLLIAHHPDGKALAELHQVMSLQEDLLFGLGVPINIAQGLMGERIADVGRGLMPLNHHKAVDAARALGIPFMCVHTPADNLVTSYLQKMMDDKKPKTLAEIIELLNEVPEIQEDRKRGPGVKIIVGSPKNKTGKIFVDMTGGTSGSEKSYEQLAKAGVGTIVCMHMPEGHRKKAQEFHINVVNAGHISNDSVGVNLFLDELEKQGVEIVPCSGLIRVSRVKKAAGKAEGAKVPAARGRGRRGRLPAARKARAEVAAALAPAAEKRGRGRPRKAK